MKLAISDPPIEVLELALYRLRTLAWILIDDSICQYSAISLFFFFIFYSLQLFQAVVVRRPFPHIARLRDRNSGSIGYSYEVRPTFRLLPGAISLTHCTTRTQLTIIDIRPATVKAVYATLYLPRRRYYKHSYSFNSWSRFPDHSAESTRGTQRSPY